MDKVFATHARAARHYGARVPYAERLFSEVAGFLHFDRSTRMIDIGAGPGNVAQGFSSFVGECLLVDPEPEMLSAAKAAEYDPQCKVDFLLSRFEDLPSNLGIYSVATLGRVAHWLERQPALAGLEEMLMPGSFVIALEAGTYGYDNNPWHRAFVEVRDRFAARSSPTKGRRAADLFANSSFIGRRLFTESARGRVSIDRLVERLFSYSSTTPEKLDSRAVEMESELRAALAPFAEDGSVTEVTYSAAMVFERKA